MHLSPLMSLMTLLALATNAMADLSITAPNATSFVVAGGSLNVAWDYTGSMPPTPATISVELVDNSKKLFTGPLALFANLATTSGGASWPIPKLGFVGDSFSIILVANVNNEATIFAQGSSFAILPEGTKASTLVDPATTAHNSASMIHSGAAGCLAIVVAASSLLTIFL